MGSFCDAFQTESGDWVPCPIFNGSNLSSWLSSMEDFLVRFQIPDIQWVNFASYYVLGDAYSWVILNENCVSWWNWAQFTAAISNQFDQVVHCVSRHAQVSSITEEDKKQVKAKTLHIPVKGGTPSDARSDHSGMDTSEQIDRSLVKNVLSIFIEIGMGIMDRYEHDFEDPMLADTKRYYSMKASNWIVEYSCPCYMEKAEECLRREKERVSHYLHASSEKKLLEKAENELLTVYQMQLLEKENSGCFALLRDNKVDDLSRMYRLFSRVAKGLEPVAEMFKKHVTAEGQVLVKQAEDATSKATADKKDASGMHKNVFVKNVMELHDKYLSYVETCFANHSISHKVVKDAFEVFCNKDIAGSKSAEVLVVFCDNILKKGGTEKVSDEALEENFEKVVKLLSYISDKDIFAESCRKKLARRLLFDKSQSDDLGRMLLQSSLATRLSRLEDKPAIKGCGVYGVYKDQDGREDPLNDIQWTKR